MSKKTLMPIPVSFLVWTDNSPGVLLRLTTLFTRRKINVESLTVSETEVAGTSRFTVTITVDLVTAATIGRQIERMIEVRRVFVFTEAEVLHREVALLRATLAATDEDEILQKYRSATIVQRGPRGTLLQYTGTEAEISSLIAHLSPFGITEFVRSGRIAVTPGGEYDTDLSRSLHDLRPGAGEGPDL
jgi:acetolactate synthase-1/3 small subunit